MSRKNPFPLRGVQARSPCRTLGHPESVQVCVIPDLVPDRVRVPVAHGVGNIAIPLKHHSLEES